MGKNVHVVHNQAGGDWSVQLEGNQRASSNHRTQRDALDEGRRRARDEKSELLIHGKNGQIRDRRSYGRDPTSAKG